TYVTGDTTIVALDSTTLDVHKKELMLIMGPSGSGKTTLLSLIGCVVYPSEGKVYIQGNEITDFSEKQLADIRLNNISFIFRSKLMSPVIPPSSHWTAPPWMSIRKN